MSILKTPERTLGAFYQRRVMAVVVVAVRSSTVPQKGSNVLIVTPSSLMMDVTIQAFALFYDPASGSLMCG
jgi:hypothetical protein